MNTEKMLFKLRHDGWLGVPQDRGKGEMWFTGKRNGLWDSNKPKKDYSISSDLKQIHFS